MNIDDIQDKYSLNVIFEHQYIDNHTNDTIFTANNDGTYTLHVDCTINEWDEVVETVETIKALDSVLMKYYQYQYKRLTPNQVLTNIENNKECYVYYHRNWEYLKPQSHSIYTLINFPIISTQHTVKYNENVYTKLFILLYDIQRNMTFEFKPINNITWIETQLKVEQLVYSDGKYINHDLTIPEIKTLIENNNIGVMYTHDVVAINGRLLTGTYKNVMRQVCEFFN